MKRNSIQDLKRLLFLLWLCVICSLNSSGTFATEDAAPCSDFLTKKTFFERRTVRISPQGELEFPQVGRVYFSEQRKRFQQYEAMLAASAAESEHAIKRNLLAQMLSANILKFGGPGGAKSVQGRQTVFAPIDQPDGTQRTEAFAILFNQLQSDAIIRGYIDPEQLNSAIITPAHVKTNGTMLQARRALGDEIDKASPKTIGAILDLMDAEKRIAQYGPITLQARLEFVVLTSNLTPSELLLKARSSDMEENMRALLNRIAFKVWLPNTVLSPASREKILKASQVAGLQSARSILENPESRFSSEDAQNESYVSHLPAVDFRYFGAIAAAGFRADPAFTSFTAELFDSYNKSASISSTAEEIQYNRQLMSGVPGAPSTPTSLQSNRDLANYVLSVVQSSLMRDLLLLPESVLSTDALIERLSRGWIMDEYSSWRMHEFLLTAAPGDLTLSQAAPEAQGPRIPVITPTMNLDEYLKYAKSKRDQSHIEHIKSARERFISAFKELIQTKKNLVTLATQAVESRTAALPKSAPKKFTPLAETTPEALLLQKKE